MEFFIFAILFCIGLHYIFVFLENKNGKTLKISDNRNVQATQTRIRRLAELEKQLEDKKQQPVEKYNIDKSTSDIPNEITNEAEEIQKYNNKINQMKDEYRKYEQEIKEIILKLQDENNILFKIQEDSKLHVVQLDKIKNQLAQYDGKVANARIDLILINSAIEESSNYLNSIREKIEKGEKLLYSMRVEYKQIADAKKEIDKREENLLDLIWKESSVLVCLEECAKKTAELDYHFSQSYIAGRKWLSEMIAEKFAAEDEVKAKILATRKRPALKAAEELRSSAAEKRELAAKLKFLEYQLKSYQEKFPFILDFEEEILNENLSSAEQIQQIDEEIRDDRASSYLSREEYMSLPPSSRNQLALDRYLSGTLSKAEIGRMYERYIGYLYEQQGYTVEYYGIIKGFEDLGRDLICRKGKEIHIVQAKCWSDKKQIHENHICQLFGTSAHFRKNCHDGETVSMHLITSTALSDTAKEIACALGVQYIEQRKLDKSYPMIKCNISRRTGEKIYHLPFDQVYDKVVIELNEGEMYAANVFEAEFHGFRRAFKYKGLKN